MIGSSSFSSNVVGSGQATGTGRLLFLKMARSVQGRRSSEAKNNPKDPS